MPRPWDPYEEPDDYIPIGGFTPMPWVIHSRDLATWTTNEYNCDACSALSGRSYPLAYWQATVLPGWHYNCDCTLRLAKSWVRESPHDLWGTEPYWWDPTQNLWQFLSDIWNRNIIFSLRQLRGEGNRYSGFDNLYPIFQSEAANAFWHPLVDFLNTSGVSKGAGWTLLNYILKLKVYGLDGIAGSDKALLNRNKKKPKAKLPWEVPVTQWTAPPWQYMSPQERHRLGIL